MLIVIALTVIAVTFQEETQSLIGIEKMNIGNPFGSPNFTTKVKFSVIRYNGDVVSAVAISCSDKIAHFMNADEEYLKSTMGIEGYFENQPIIKSYKKLQNPSFIPSKGNFTHKIEVINVSLK